MMKLENQKTLYFEGAGWSGANSSKDTIGNCRIRTAFTNLKGEQIYLEMTTRPIHNNLNKLAKEYGIVIDFMFNITEDPEVDDCNESRITYDRDWLKDYRYDKKDITKVVNTLCGADFDTIEVLPDFAGYRVHKGNKDYNLADNFNYNKKLTAKRNEIKEYFNNIEKSEGKKYPNFGLWVDDADENILHLLRHFNGYNKHWTINASTENWVDTITEAKLGMYGC